MPAYKAHIRIAFADASMLYSANYRSFAFDLSMIGWLEDNGLGTFSSMLAGDISELEYGLDIVFKKIAPLGELSKLTCEILQAG